MWDDARLKAETTKDVAGKVSDNKISSHAVFKIIIRFHKRNEGKSEIILFIERVDELCVMKSLKSLG